MSDNRMVGEFCGTVSGCGKISQVIQGKEAIDLHVWVYFVSSPPQLDFVSKDLALLGIRHLFT